MKDDISVQLLTQTSDNIQKLFDLSTRIDERVKSLQQKQVEIDDRLNEVASVHTNIIQRLVVTELKLETPIYEELGQIRKALSEADRRLLALEHVSRGNEGRWDIIFKFAIQLIWITLAAYVLFKLNLNPPPVP